MAEKTLLLKVIIPDKIFFEGECEMVGLSTIDGDIGIYPEHVSITCILAPGVLSIFQNGDVKKAALHTGFAEILGDSVTVLAESAEWPDEIDVARAEKARERAEERLKRRDADLDVQRAELALRKAITRINILK